MNPARFRSSFGTPSKLLAAAIVGLAMATGAPPPAHAQAASGAATSAAPTGLWLTTPYPEFSAQAGKDVSVPLSLRNRGLPPQRALMGPRFEQFAMVSQAAVAGLGLAIVPRFLVEEELRSGALVIPVDRSLVGQEGYYLVYPEEKANLPAVTAFRDWLLAEVGPSA